jgi:alkylation response protein AidB-like acyl-CoA dehydrogenase
MTTARPAGALGGSWLLDGPPSSPFTPERRTDEHRLIAQTTATFAEQEVLPALDRLEQKDWATARSLIKRCGELGLLGVDVPAAYGGVELDRISSLIVSEHIGRSASFATAFGAQVNLCILPLVMFGTEEQKSRYLPELTSGASVGAYALTEASSGSDALSVKARATRQPDGSFRLSGEKLWITNGGFADVFVIFAKAEGDAFTAFIVERDFGVASGREEHKMGLHGSSTTPLILQDVPVPAANVLGEIGRGHKLAFSVLNFGRLKLGAMCAGGCRIAIGESARYSASRRQFGQPIATFGAIRHKLGEMTARAYALESVLYRTAASIDHQTGERAMPRPLLAAALEELAIEASIAKVLGSETLDFVLDENVQVHGANGYVRDYPAERHYRDARINRIFEGTNEINRLVISGMLTKRAVKGDLALIPAARGLLDEVMGPPSLIAESGQEHLLAPEAKAVEAFKKVTVLALGAAMERFGRTLQDEQEVLLWIADLAIDTYASESALARTITAEAITPSTIGLHHAAARTFISDAALRVETTARQILAAIAEGDTLRTHLAALRRVLKVLPADTVRCRRVLADATVERGGYLF